MLTSSGEPGELMFPFVVGGGGGGGSVTPGLLMFPAEAVMVSAKLSKVAARVDFSLFISSPKLVFRGSQKSSRIRRWGPTGRGISMRIITALQISCKESS